MSKSNKIKLSKRLSSIESMVSTGYEHIWDCCCDHGLLGFQLLQNSQAQHIHFVDIVAPLLIEIENKLQRFYCGNNNWHVHCLDVALLPLRSYQTEKHLIIIAGVGGELLMEFLSKLLPLTLTLNVEFILSPVHHNYQLRQFLNRYQCYLMDERLVEDNNRCYEIMHISQKMGDPISLVGDTMWDFTRLSHRAYLQSTICHYQRIAQNPNINVSGIIKAYQDLSTYV